MRKRTITDGQIVAFEKHLCEEERSMATVEKYLREIRQFTGWLAGRSVSKIIVTQWKEELAEHGYEPSTINGKLTALERFFNFAGWTDCRVKHLRLQRQMFRDSSRMLTRDEYMRLITTANRTGKERLALLMETICGTGIRVSELKYITVEAIQQGKTTIALKGKIRTILFPRKLCRKLLKYAGKQKIASGELFLTKSGQSLSRKQIWAEMKTICGQAGVEATKVFPHNLRHLFARTFYKTCQDVVKLADVLGHSSIETTRIYLLSTGLEHQQMLDRLQLVS